MSAPNQIKVAMTPSIFSITPVYARVKAGHQPLLVEVNWDANNGEWNKVVVKGICFPDGKPCKVFPDRLVFDLRDPGPQKMLFDFKVAQEVECKFSVEFHRVFPVEMFEVDPGVILQPGP